MSILDDAIREHLELKRAHGAGDAELKKLEDEAFGPPQRPEEPDPYAEAPTEFLVAPGSEEPAPEGEAAARRAPNIADLQEAPEMSDAPEPGEDIHDEEQPAAEHEPVADAGPSTEERHAIASQPTEMFDVEGQFEDAAAEADAPSDEQLVDAGMAEPRLTPPADPAPAEDEPADEFDEFFSEQRLSDELNQALEAPLPDEPGAPPTEEATQIYEVEEELPPEPEPAPEPPSDEHEAPAPTDPPAAEHDDVLEDTPEFLQDDPEDENLWFEQRPPKDIDFGD